MVEFIDLPARCQQRERRPRAKLVRIAGPPVPAVGMTHRWFWKAIQPERFGQACRVISRGNLNSILVEFADGARVVTSRFAVRRLQP